MSNIANWLEGLGLPQYAHVFAEQAIDIDVLPDLTDADLEKLGLPLGHRKRILKAIAALAAGEPSTADSPAAALVPSRSK